MGYAFALSPCYGCKRVFAYNPMTVPSVRDPKTNSREPLCSTCMAAVNAERVRRGMDPFPVQPDAYEACDEADLTA